MSVYSKVSNVLGIDAGRLGFIASGYRAKTIVGAGIGGTVGAITDRDNRGQGFLMGAGIGGGLGAGTRALQGRFGRAGLVGARDANLASQAQRELERNLKKGPGRP